MASLGVVKIFCIGVVLLILDQKQKTGCEETLHGYKTRLHLTKQSTVNIAHDGRNDNQYMSHRNTANSESSVKPSG